ncbi:MAG: hypothetical protein WGN25_20230 [Candidatus Electrothrix sp. GW3-4]|uniref:hypothetical protein n=1 Tax=Candidatus Electrothrix sp. GW3-4 TaxID=3126740 RepID=UPI0030D103AC
MNHTIRSIQSPALSFSLRRQATALRKRESSSEDFIRLSAYTLGMVCLFFFVVGLFFSWNIARKKATFAQQQLVHESLIREKAGLKARRDKLLAKPRLVALGAAQLDLHLPEKEQEHYLY